LECQHEASWAHVTEATGVAANRARPSVERRSGLRPECGADGYELRLRSTPRRLGPELTDAPVDDA